MKISFSQKNKLIKLCVMVCISCLAGGFFSYFTGNAKQTFESFRQGVVDSFFISSFLGYYIFFLSTGTFLKRYKFIYIVFVNTVIYIILFLIGRLIGQVVLNNFEKAIESFFVDENFYLGIGLVFFACLTISFFLQVNRLTGQNILKNFVAGTYHQPKEEERFFMFLDMKSSTHIAEKIGHRQFHSFLNNFFYDLTEAILETEGEIYKYVGDEIIISWKKKKGIKNCNCLRCFFLIEEQISLNVNKYIKLFEIVPEFRAGLHFGMATVGELGDIKQEIVFLGDTINTTARIIEYCSQKKKKLIVSNQVIKLIHPPGEFILEDMGLFQPRGKQKSVQVISVTK